MQHSSPDALFNNEEGACGAYLGGIFVYPWGVEGSSPQTYDSSSALSLDTKSSHHPLETNNCQVE